MGLVAGAMLFAVAAGLAAALVMALRDRARLRGALKEANERADTVLAHVGEVVFSVDAEGRWDYLSDAWEAFSGYSVAETIGTPSTRLLHPEDFAEAKRLFPRLLSGELQKPSIVQRYRHKSGTWRHAEVTATRRIENGVPAGTSGRIRDVTENSAMREKLFNTERRYRRMSELAPVGIFQADAQGRVVYVNQVALERIGMTMDQVRGMQWVATLASEDGLDKAPLWQGFSPTQPQRTRMMRFRGADGADVWVQVTTTAEFDSFKTLTGFFGVIIDLTGQMSARSELAASEQRFEVLAAMSPVGIFRIDDTGLCTYVNPAWTELTGMTALEALGDGWLRLLHPDDRDNILQLTQEAINRGSGVRVTHRWLRADGKVVWVETLSSPLRDEQGKVIGYTGINLDITERKALEDELNSAKERAERATAAKSIFLANMSHEIRTPMNGVVGFTELLHNTPLNEVQRRYVDLIAQSGTSMMRLLGDILDLSRIEAGRLNIACESFDLGEMLTTCLRLFDPIAAAKGLSLELAIDPALPRRVMGDALRLRQIVVNLLGNAAKFTEKGSVALSARQDMADGAPVLRIAVRDTGIGISPAALKAIFDPFAQSHPARDQRHDGAGLGLAISAELAALMRGSIDAQSVPGAGSTFMLTLPLVPAGDEAEPAAPAADTAQAAIAGLDILIAEDDPISQELMRAMAGALGINATIAGNGEEAVALARRAAADGHPYALALMDMRMPVLDGVAAARALREGGLAADALPIIALTANAYPEDIAACTAAGMQGHLAKPVSLDALARAIERHAINAPPRPTASAAPPERLRERFEQRKMAVRAALAAAGEAPGVEDAVILADALHKLAGTAGFFGEIDLGETAARCEKELRRVEAAGVAAAIASTQAALDPLLMARA
ncbi:PAS domain S-box protein [Sphingomonas sp.]|uniref:PAS domain-containing hybrid sensor histidine kinase/response regulator n=1 Tax=Sphingomonas sp. TaxID=28214 RepID=UPI001D86AB06|nr:PAS domain S-box protein [Sphingomonas sp.]MBX9797105.1 PAS domain S-box protein [Sphingomonas sp.]